MTFDKNLEHLIVAALVEDIGTGDITSELLIPEDVQAEMLFVAREELVVCGVEVPGLVYEQLSSYPPASGVGIKITVCIKDGALAHPGDIIATAKGPARRLLTGERVALNIMQRMSGVATLTRKYVEAVGGTKAIILDTRKTMPGMRALDKYAVRMGGGQNHRMGLWDMVLVKDNHIAVSGQRSAVSEIVIKIRDTLLAAGRWPLPTIVVECDTLVQVEEALVAAPDRILLDNMDLATMRKAVLMSAGKVPLEASGGVSLETVRAIAETGVDYISVGKLTHSAPAVDIGADIKILT